VRYVIYIYDVSRLRVNRHSDKNITSYQMLMEVWIFCVLVFVIYLIKTQRNYIYPAFSRKRRLGCGILQYFLYRGLCVSPIRYMNNI
jgi:hypothetical protein